MAFFWQSQGSGKMMKMLVCANLKIYLPIDTFWRHSLPTPFKKCYYSEPVRTNTCAVYDPVCCFFAVAWMGLGGPNLAGLAQGLQIHPYIYPAQLWNVACCLSTMCHCICRANSRVKRAAPLGPTFTFRTLGMCTLCYPRCALVFTHLSCAHGDVWL